MPQLEVRIDVLEKDFFESVSFANALLKCPCFHMTPTRKSSRFVSCVRACGGMLGGSEAQLFPFGPGSLSLLPCEKCESQQVQVSPSEPK